MASLISGAKIKVGALLKSYDMVEMYEWSTLKTKIRETLSKYFYEKTKRSPMILPIIIDV